MQDNILIFVTFSLIIITIYHLLHVSFRKYILLIANIIFYLSISRYNGGGYYFYVS